MSACSVGFDKTLRLLKPFEFKRVFDQRRSAHNNFFGVYVSKNTLNHARVGLVVSKKVSKKAVIRNRIKRQIRESFRHQQNELGSMDFIVVAKLPLEQIAFDTITCKLQPLWTQALKRCKH